MKYIITFSLIITVSLYMIVSYQKSATNKQINEVAKVILRGLY